MMRSAPEWRKDERVRMQRPAGLLLIGCAAAAPGAFVPRQNTAQLMAVPLPDRAGRYGGWAIADQTVKLDPDSHGKRGTVVFAALEWGDKATAFVN